MAEDNSTEGILKELAATVNALKKDIKELKTKDRERTYPYKRRRDGSDEGEGNASHDGDIGENRDGDNLDYSETENDASGPSCLPYPMKAKPFWKLPSTPA